MTAKKKSTDFESAITQLESLVQEMESGELTLEESLQAFETGIKLTRECQARLAAAEQKIQILLEEDDKLVPQPFDTDSQP